jgi:hypothetical protein
MNTSEEASILKQHQNVVQEVISRQAKSTPSGKTFTIKTQFNDSTNSYELIESGWKNGKKITNQIISIKLKDEGVFIEKDQTKRGIKKELVTSGILEDYISQIQRKNSVAETFGTISTVLKYVNYVSPKFDLSTRQSRLQIFGIFGFLFLMLGILLAIFPRLSTIFYTFDFSLAGIVVIVTSALGIIVWAILDNISDSLSLMLKENYQDAEKRAKENPDKIKPAWDVANSTLSAYFNRNLKQVDWIFRLSVVVMLVGLGLVGVGIFLAYQKPESIAVSIVGGISGIITQFIGATFLFIYKSTITQANKYTETLERINAVGMAMQILDGIGQEERIESIEKLVIAKIDISKILLQKAQQSMDSTDSKKD